MPLTNMRNSCMERRLIKILVVIVNDVKRMFDFVRCLSVMVFPAVFLLVQRTTTAAPTLNFVK